MGWYSKYAQIYNKNTRAASIDDDLLSLMLTLNDLTIVQI